MKIRFFSTAVALAALLCLPALGQEEKEKTERQEEIAPPKQRQVDGANKLDEKTSGANVRASRLIGMTIQNSKEQNVGEISDMVIDARQGDIKYVAVTYGGFLGVGNDMHAVPFKAIQFETDPENPDTPVLLLDISKETIENSKGFNESTWPVFADEAYKDMVKSDSRSDKIDRPTDRKDDRAAENQTDSGQQDHEKSEKKSDPTRAGNLDGKTTGTKIRASQLMGMAIENLEQKDVGSINDLVIDVNKGQVNFVAVSYGGLLGFGDELHAVPFRAFMFMEDQDDENESVLALDVNEKKLEGAKGFDEENWPNFGDKSYTEAVVKRYSFDDKDNEKGKSKDDKSDDQSEKSAGKNKIDK